MPTPRGGTAFFVRAGVEILTSDSVKSSFLVLIK